MSALNDQERRAYALVDDALRHLPLVAAPKLLLPKIMARMQTLPRFRLDWLDYALSLFASGIIGGLFWLWYIFLDASARLELRAYAIEGLSGGASLPILIALSAVAFAMSLLLIAAFVFRRGQALNIQTGRS